MDDFLLQMPRSDSDAPSGQACGAAQVSSPMMVTTDWKYVISIFEDKRKLTGKLNDSVLVDTGLCQDVHAVLSYMVSIKSHYGLRTMQNRHRFSCDLPRLEAHRASAEQRYKRACVDLYRTG